MFFVLEYFVLMKGFIIIWILTFFILLFLLCFFENRCSFVILGFNSLMSRTMSQRDLKIFMNTFVLIIEVCNQNMIWLPCLFIDPRFRIHFILRSCLAYLLITLTQLDSMLRFSIFTYIRYNLITYTGHIMRIIFI